MLFKGGTSFSKGFGLIQRYSEDFDVTIFRGDPGKAASIQELEGLSGRKRRKALDAVKVACETYVNGRCLNELSAIISKTSGRSGMAAGQLRIEPDPEDRQALRLRYPTATPHEAYVVQALKIESGAIWALEPNSELTVRPYLHDDVPDGDFGVENVTTVDVMRTFWDKIVILHGLRRWFDNRGELKRNSQRVSRHRYDVHQLLDSDAGQMALKDR